MAGQHSGIYFADGVVTKVVHTDHVEVAQEARGHVVPSTTWWAHGAHKGQVLEGLFGPVIHIVPRDKQRLLLVIRFMADLLRKYRGSVVIMVGRGGAEPHYVHNWPPIFSW